MNNQRTIFIVVGVVIVLILLFAFLVPRNNKYSWSENYITESKQPYGTYLVRGMLRNYLP